MQKGRQLKVGIYLTLVTIWTMNPAGLQFMKNSTIPLYKLIHLCQIFSVFFFECFTDMSPGSQISKFNEMPLETESCCLSLSVKTQYFKSYILTTLSLLKGKKGSVCVCVYEGVFIHKYIYLVMIFICFLSS